LIKKIIMDGIKNQKGVQLLTGRDIICGPNGSGKTTRLQALGISLLGYCPGKGKLPAETYKLSPGGDMTVGIETDSFKAARTYSKAGKRSKDGSITIAISESVAVTPGRGEKNDTQRRARIAAEVGNFPVMLDFGEFLNLSDAKRRDFFYSLSPITTDLWDKQTVEKRLKDTLLTMELQVNNVEQYDIMAGIIKNALEQYKEDQDLQSGLQAMLDWAKAEQTHWNSEKENARGAVKKLADMKNDLAETDRNIAHNKAEVAGLQEQLIEVEKQLSGNQEKKKAADKHYKRIDELKETILDIEEKLSQLPVSDDGLDEQIADLQGRITEIDIEASTAPLDSEEFEKENTIRNLDEQVRELDKEVSRAEGEMRALQATVRSIQNTLQDMNGSQVRVCIISPLIACSKDFTPYLDYVQKQQDEKRAYVILKQKELGEKREQIQQLTLRKKAIQEERRAITSKAGAQVKANEEIRKEIAKLEKQKADRAQERTSLEDRLKMFQEEFQILQAEPVEAIAPLDALEMRRDGLSKQASEMKAKIYEQEKAKVTLSNLKASMIDSKKASYNADCSKWLADALGPKGLKGELVKNTLGPLQDDVQKNLFAMGLRQEFFFQTESDTGKEVFQFGWIDDRGRELNFDALSTGQQLLLLAALMVTLLKRANPPLKVLAIDNIENLDGDNFKRAVHGLSQIKDDLDNIILAGVISPEEDEIPGWQVWDLGRQEVDADAKTA